MTLSGGAIAMGLAAAAMIWVLSAIVIGSWEPWKVCLGADGKYSTSKFQFWAWTTVIVFAYVAIYAQRCLTEGVGPRAILDKFPHNLLLVMGFSGATMAAAKAITSGYVASGKVVKTTTGGGGILTDDDGGSDLSKVQLVGWTAIGIFVYLMTTLHANVSEGLPDIDGALMVLMGLGQGTYIGKKLVTTDSPQLLSVTALVRPGRTVTLGASGLGQQPGNILIDDHALIGVPVQWDDTKVGFNLPQSHPNGTPWRDGQTVSVSVVSGGQSSNVQPLIVGLVPRIFGMQPTAAKAGSAVKIAGQLLMGSSNPSISVDGLPATIISATDTEIQFAIPAALPPKKGAVILVNVDGNAAPTQSLDVAV